MNTFALQIFDDEEKLCTFYTVKWDDAKLSETDKFFLRFKEDSKLKTSLQELASFIEVVIGNEYGALPEFFKFENKAQGLPPKGKFGVGEITINYSNFPLRLYCLRISNSLVVLFNGAEKTSNSAQEGKTSMAFNEANLFAERILEALRNSEIYITSDQREFKYYDGSDEIIL